MKKTVLFLSVILMALSTQAQKPLATFFSEDGYKFWVIIDGKRMNPEPAYRVENIVMENDWAKAKIIFEDANLDPIEKTIQGVDVDGNPSSVTWVIKQNNKGKWKVSASSWKKLDEPAAETKPVTPPAEQQTEPALTGQTKTVTTQTTTTTSSGPDQSTVSMSASENNVSMTIDVNDGSESANMDINMNVPGINAQQESTATYTTVTTTTTYEESTESNGGLAEVEEKPNPLPGYNGRIGCDNPMTEDRFAKAKNSIASKTFEDSKMTVAKQVLRANCLLVSQVKDIMKLFTYEDDKLDFAIEAYSKTFDIDNYYELNDEFTFESSIDELNDAIGQ